MRKVLLLLALGIAHLSVLAGNVTEAEALQKAQEFMKGKSFKQSNLRRASSVTQDNGFYVFNAEQNGGYVIVSADDRTVPILGYSDKGKLDLDNMPENMRAWLQGYTAVIKSLSNEQPSQTNRASQVIGPPIDPLITAKWDQSEPFNNNCPMDGDKRSVTGCVAIAMAQVMYYHKWPQVAVPALPAYTTSTKQISVEPLTATTFKWDLMKDEYEEDETGDAADAVAELVRYCGQSVFMDYTNSESGSSVCASNFIYDYGYSKTARTVVRSDYSTTEWEQLLYDELNNGRPVMFAASSMGVFGNYGHQFIIDGYDNQGLFHANWGWRGDQNGFYSISILSPHLNSTDAMADAMGESKIAVYYIGSQTAIIGLQPDHNDEGIPTIQHWHLSDLDDAQINTVTRSNSNQDFDFTLRSARWPVEGKTDVMVTFDHAYGLYKDGNLMQIVEEQDQLISHRPADMGDVTEFNDHIVFGKNLPDGDYWLIDLYRKDSNQEWQRSSSYDIYFIIASIEGNTLRLKRSTDIENEVYVNNVQLIGAMKTNRGMTAKVNWTNNGYRNENYFYVWLNDQPIGGIPSFLEHGETGDVSISFVMTEAGSGTLKITANNDDNNILWSDNVTFTETLDAKLSGTVTFGGATDGEVDGRPINSKVIEGTTINTTVTLKNIGENAFNDNVAFVLHPSGSDYWENHISIIKKISLAIGEEKSFELQYPDLEVGQEYCMMVYYYEYAKFESGPNGLAGEGSYESRINHISWGDYCFVGITSENPLLQAKLSATTTIEGEKDGRIEGTTINATVTIKNVGTKAYDEDTDFYLGLNSDPVGKITKRVSLAVGEEKSYELQFPDLEAGEEYCVGLWYYTFHYHGGNTGLLDGIGWKYCTVGVPLIYKLIYMVDGVEYRSLDVEHGAAITPLAEPTKETYVFSGWSEIPETMPGHDVIITGTFERQFDVGHVVNVVNFIMASYVTPEDIATYDMNNDDELNIGDIILIVKTILDNDGGSAASRAIRRASGNIDFSKYTAVQFELKTDDNTSVEDIHLVGSMAQSHQMMCQQKDANTYNVVVFSLSNQLMKPENGRIIEVDGANLMMQNIIVSNTSGETYSYQNMNISTGISNWKNDNEPAIIYDLKGNRLDGKGLKSGLYIINGKKTVVR